MLMQEETSPKDGEDFDFEKKLPDIPNDTPKNEFGTSMKFSPAHFQDDISHDETHQPQMKGKKEEYSDGDVEEDEIEEEEILEPEQEASQWKPQEASPGAVPPQSEEILIPTQSRSPSPILEKEPKHEALSNKSPESFPTEEKLISNVDTSPISQPEITSRQADPATLVQLASTLAEPTITASAEPLKTRSVKSTKSDGTGRSFLGKHPINLFF